MLKKGLPKYGDLVICTVKRISPFAAWVLLDEYSNLEGIIHVSEVAGKIVYDIREFVKLNKKYVAKVIGIDEEKKLIKLSLKRVSEYEEKDKLNKHRLEKRAFSIINQAVKNIKKESEIESYIQKILENFESLNLFLEKVKEGFVEFEDKELIAEIKRILEKSIKEKVFRIKAEIILRSFEPDGIERIKSSLLKLEESGLKVKYISAPRYLVELETKNPKKDEKKFEDLLKSFSKEFNAKYKMV